MMQYSGLPKIIVLGTTYSGSGAVYDYLRYRGDGYDPLSGAEYLLPQIPHGLMCLRSAIGCSFHHAVADHARKNFLVVAKKLARKPTRSRYGKGYGVILPTFLNEISQLVRDATASEFSFQLDWRKAEETRMKRTLTWAATKFFNYKSQPVKVWLPVSEGDFVSLCQKMHDRLFATSGSRSAAFTLLNQAGSGWNPVQSTIFFSNRKVLLVTRDPRDQFAELKIYKRAKDVDQFIKWYGSMQQRIALDDPNLFTVRFEHFVDANKAMISNICAFAGIEDSVLSSYSVSKSAQNIGVYKKILSNEEIVKIESCLSPFLWEESK